MTDARRAFPVVPSRRRVAGVREGEPVVLLPVEAVHEDASLLALPTVRRVARDGLRGCVLVPLVEWDATFPEGRRDGGAERPR